jgi:hypothetical protein
MQLKNYTNLVLLTTITVLLFVLSGCTDTQSSRSNKPTIELNTDRPGSDITTLALDKPKATLCHDACQSNSECVAWTYVKPGIINANAHCRLKSKLPDPKRSSCCISGRK